MIKMIVGAPNRFAEGNLMFFIGIRLLICMCARLAQPPKADVCFPNIKLMKTSHVIKSGANRYMLQSSISFLR